MSAHLLHVTTKVFVLTRSTIMIVSVKLVLKEKIAHQPSIFAKTTHASTEENVLVTTTTTNVSVLMDGVAGTVKQWLIRQQMNVAVTRANTALLATCLVREENVTVLLDTLESFVKLMLMIVRIMLVRTLEPALIV